MQDGVDVVEDGVVVWGLGRFEDDVDDHAWRRALLIEHGRYHVEELVLDFRDVDVVLRVAHGDRDRDGRLVQVVVCHVPQVLHLAKVLVAQLRQGRDGIAVLPQLEG